MAPSLLSREVQLLALSRIVTVGLEIYYGLAAPALQSAILGNNHAERRGKPLKLVVSHTPLSLMLFGFSPKTCGAFVMMYFRIAWIGVQSVRKSCCLLEAVASPICS
jgi:hypothetical protein